MPGGRPRKASRSTSRNKPKKRDMSLMTTMKISRHLMQNIEEKSNHDESVDQTIKRVLKIGSKGKLKPKGPLPPTTTIKVSRETMEYIKERTKPKESREMTLARLFGVTPDDGNLLSEPASVPKGVDRESAAVQPNDGNVAGVKS